MIRNSKKQKRKPTKQWYYLVLVGRAPGVYSDWEECKKRVVNFAGAWQKKYDNPFEPSKIYNLYMDGKYDYRQKKVKPHQVQIFQIDPDTGDINL